MFDGSRAISVWQDFVRGLVYAHRDKFGCDPRLDQPVDGFPDFENWSVIDRAIHVQARPFKYGLAGFIEKHCQDKGGKRAVRVKTLSDAVETAAAAPVQQAPSAQPAFTQSSVVKKPEYPYVVTLKVPDFEAKARGQKNKIKTIHYIMSEDSPQDRADVIDRVLQHIAHKKCFPDEHDTRMKQYDREYWKEQSRWLQATENHTLRQFIPSMICELAAAHYQSDQKTVVGKSSGLVTGHNKCDWAMIFMAYDRDGRWPLPLPQVIQTYIHKLGVTDKPAQSSAPAFVCK